MASQTAKLRSPALLSAKASAKLQRRTTGLPKQLILFYAQQYPWTLSACVVALILSGLLESIGFAALLPVLGKLTGSNASLPEPLDRWFSVLFQWLGLEPTLNALLVMVIGLLVAKIAIGFLVVAFVGWVQARLTGEFRRRVIASLGNARWAYFTHQSSGRAVNTLLSETIKAGAGLTAICQLVATTIQVVIFAGTAALISWKATAIGLLASLAGTALLSTLIRLIRHNQRERIITVSNMAARMIDGLGNMKTLKAMGAERRMTKLVARDVASLRRNMNIDIVLNQAI